MPSFTKMGSFPVGYFRATTAWLLRERRDVVTRIATLQAEMARIGFVTMNYRKVTVGDSTKATAERLGFSIPEGTTLARLVQAYIATGGNPFNISGFLHPNTTEVSPQADGGVSVAQDYPGGGAPGAQSVAYDNPLPEGPEDGSTNPNKSGYEAYEGGYIDHPGYKPARMGGRMDRGSWDDATVVRVMHDTRNWANKEIKARLQNREWQIIKLSDCWEQLRVERDEVLMEAFGGQLIDLPGLDDETFDPKRLCQVIIADMYSVLFDVDDSGIPTGFKPNPGLGLLFFAYKDVPADDAGPMG